MRSIKKREEIGKGRIMDIVLFDNYDLMASALIELAENASTLSAVICKYNDAVNLIQSLIEHGKLDILEILLSHPDIDAYNKEYIISVSPDMELWCEPLDRNNGMGYIKFNADLVFITGDSNISAIKDINKDICYETYFGKLPEDYEVEPKEKSKDEEKTSLEEEILELVDRLLEIFE